MATPEQITELRWMIDDPTGSDAQFTDQYLGDLIDKNPENLDLAAVSVWEQKAAGFSTAVDISESGSSRSNSGLYRNALEQANYWRKKSVGADIPATARRSRTRSITRS